MTHAELVPLLSKIDQYDGRISKKNIFEARKGLTATFHPVMGSIFMFGGVGRNPISTVDSYCEDTIEFSKVKDGGGARQMHHNINNGSSMRKASLKKSSNRVSEANSAANPATRTTGQVSLNFREPMHSEEPKASGTTDSVGKNRFNKDPDRSYHLMVPYKNYLVIYGGTSDTGGLVNRAYRPVHCEIYFYDL